MSGFLGRLRRDAHGNALAIMAAALIPLAGFTGCAVDAARLFAVKARLQQACDAGVLAGRKDMLSSSSGMLDTTDTGPAKTFFYNNFTQGFFGTPKAVFNPSVNTENNVNGAATVDVPMTIMKMFGQSTKAISVSCQAVFDPADTNVMFVLDTTGSMACLPTDDYNTCLNYLGAAGNLQVNSDGSTTAKEKSGGSRIQGVRDAVLSFYDALTTQADPTTNFRFGFLPFSATVNVGKLLQPMGYMATQWSYQSREVYGDANSGSPTTSIDTSKATSGDCTASGSVRSPATAKTYASNGSATLTSWSWGSGKCTKSVQTLIPNWQYKQLNNVDVSQYVRSTAASPVNNPAQITSATSWWPGCVEERGAGLDQDIDTPPSGSAIPSGGPTSSSYWGPIWSDVEFARFSDGEITSTARTVYGRPYANPMPDYAVLLEELPCPLAASRLSSITLAAGGSKSSVRASIQNYMLASNGYRPFGVTYLDEGMLWGMRMLSPNGIFRADVAAWPGRVTPKNILIFLTDGQMETDCYAYSSHGMEQYDHRVTGGTCNDTTLDSAHETRFTNACQAAASRRIQVFVILFGQSVSALPTLFVNCAAASGGKAYYATNTTDLKAKFNEIAQQVAMLRINK